MPSKKRELFPYIIFFLSFSVYLTTILPYIYWRDAPEFQTVGFLLDIAHPSGSPLYAIVVKLFTFIPIGSIAFKTTLVSTFFAAGISVLVYFIVKMILGKMVINVEEESSYSVIPWIAFFGSLSFSFSTAVWENAIVAEVYTLQNFFTAILILILLEIQSLNVHPDTTWKITRLFFCLAFLFGLGLGAHSILVLYFPLLLIGIYFLGLRSRSINVTKMYGLLCFFFLLGLSVYLYLPVRSVKNPYYDWGDPQTFYNLMSHVSDRKDASFHFSFPKDVLPSQIVLYFGLYYENFSILGIILGVIGLIYLMKRRENVLLNIFVIFFFPPLLFFIRWWQWHSAYIPNFLIFSILISVGVWASFRAIKRGLKQYQLSKSYLVLIGSFLAIHLFLLFTNHFRENDKSDYWTPRDLLKNVLYDIPSNAVIFSNRAWFGLGYLQQSEVYRPDITLFSVSSFLAPELFSKIDQAKFPNVTIPLEADKELGPAFLQQNIGSHPIYWEPNVMRNGLVEEYLIPEGLLFRLSPNPTQIDSEMIKSYLNRLPKQINFEKEIQDTEEKVFYGEIISGQGSFFLQRGQYELALHHFKLATGLLPNKTDFLNMLGVSYAYLKEYKLAEETFKKAIAVKPYNHEPYLNLGEMYLFNNNFQKAEEYFTKVLDLQPVNAKATYYLGKVHVERGNKDQALMFFRKALELDPEYTDVKTEIDQLLGQITLNKRKEDDR